MAIMLSHSRLAGAGYWNSEGVYVGPSLDIVAAPTSSVNMNAPLPKPIAAGVPLISKIAIVAAVGAAFAVAFILGRDGDA